MFSILKGYNGYHFNRETGGWEYIPSDNWIFAKVFRKNSKDEMSSAPAMLPSKFELFKEVEPESLDEAFNLIKELATDSSLLAVRGRLVEPASSFRRNAKNFDTKIPSNIIAIDMDSIPFAGEVNLREWGNYVVSLLHEFDSEVFPLDLGFIVHASSSAGIKPGIRMHMLIQANRKVTQNQIKGYFSELNYKARVKLGHDLVDLNFYSATQPHFFADPKFYDGIQDPLEGKGRLMFVSGSVCTFNRELPEFVSRRADVSKADFKILDMVEGRYDELDAIESLLAELDKATDNVYLRLLPRIYHNAWQRGYSLDLLGERVAPVLEKYISWKGGNRTVQDYIDNARSETLRVFLGESRRIIPANVTGVPVRMLEVDSAEDELFLKLNELPPKGCICFIKASLGTGKTTSVANWLSKGKIDGTFLTITNTKSLVQSNATKFGAANYDKEIERNEFAIGLKKGISTTIHSLHKFKAEASSIKLLFIDECDAVMNDILFSVIVGRPEGNSPENIGKIKGENKGKREIIETLKIAMQSADYVLLSDGDISEETIHAYGSLIDFTKPLAAYNHQRPMLYNARAVEYCSQGSIWAEMQKQLMLGKKSILVSDCGPEVLNKFGLLLRTTTGQIVKEIHSESKQDKDVDDIMNKTNESLKEQGVVGLLCSPSVTGGVDFNYFENVFVITKHDVQSPNLRFQATRRDRGARNIFYYTSAKAKGFCSGADQYTTEGPWLDVERGLYAKRRELESKNYQNTFRYYLIDQGCPIRIDSSKRRVDDGGIDYDKSYLELRTQVIMESSPTEVTPRHNDAYKVKEDILKYYHLSSTNDITEDIVYQFLEENPVESAEFFHKLYANFWESIKKCSNNYIVPFMDAIKNNAKQFHLDTGCSAAPKLASMYLKRAGIVDLSCLDNIKDWYRTYCLENSIDVPVEFLVDDSLDMELV